MKRFLCVLTLLAIAEHGQASPNLSLDSATYEELEALRTLGLVAPFSGGFLPISETRAQRLLAPSRVPPLVIDTLASWWISPVHILRVRSKVADGAERTYSTPAHPRDVVGSVAVACEREETAHCIERAGISTDIESAGGYGEWVTGVLAVRGTGGIREGDNRVELLRSYVLSELGPIAFELGRDTFTLGPASRTSISWGRHAPPLDHARISTAYPWRLSSNVAVSAAYLVGTLRDPQRYPGAIVTAARGQADIADAIEVGATQLLQLGGSGAPSLGLVDFLLEHVHRRDPSATETDSSNRRFGLDVNSHIASLRGLRLYYAVMFEDIRKSRFLDAVRYDADHLFGIELAAIGTNQRGVVTLEWTQTGARSHEHSPRTTGFTNAGYVVGAPLGPDAQSLFVGGRIPVNEITFSPWLELARLSSDTYAFIPYGPIDRIAAGEDEARYRLGARVRLPVRRDVHVEVEAVIEHIDDFGFAPGATRNSGSGSAAIVWYPHGRLGRIEPE
jgi:hypothetical protein